MTDVDAFVVAALQNDMETLVKIHGTDDEFYEPMLKMISYYLSEEDFAKYMKVHQKQLGLYKVRCENYN